MELREKLGRRIYESVDDITEHQASWAADQVCAMPDFMEMLELWRIYENGEFAQIVFPEGFGVTRNRDAFDALITRVRIAAAPPTKP